MTYSQRKCGVTMDVERGTSTTGVNDVECLPNVFKINQSNIGTVVYSPQTIIQNVQGHPTEKAKPPSSVSRFSRPVQSFAKTESYLKLEQTAKERCKVILHCYGFPGTGKSEIVRKLAEEFPFTDRFKHTVKWHIECNDRGHDLMGELQELVKNMQRSGLFGEGTIPLNIIEDLRRDKASSLVEAIRASKTPVLIILEDVSSDHHALYTDFLRSIDNTDIETPFHLYVATKKRSSLLRRREAEDYRCYVSAVVEGFNKTESLKFLLNIGQNSEENIRAAEQVFKRFSGSPLGLQASRGYCREARISYKDYLEILEEDEQTVHSDETRNLQETYGRNVNHIFQAITMPFRPSEDCDKQVQHTWNVLSCLSYLHCSRIPRFVVERFCQHFRDGNVKNHRIKNKTESGQIISKLEDLSMCVVEESDDISFHEVMLHAFRVSKLNPGRVAAAAEVISCLITKDMRDKEVAAGVTKLLPHMDTLLGRVETDHVNELLLNLIISHLYEVFGAVATNQSSGLSDKCRDCLSKSLSIVYSVIFGDDISLEEFIRKYSDKDLVDVADELVGACKAAGARLEPGFICKYESKVILLRQGEELDFLEGASKDKSHFPKIRSCLKLSPVLTTEMLEILRLCGVFLDEEIHRNIFFAERLTSILQSLSRVILYKNSDSPSLEYEQSLWLSKLAYHIALLVCKGHEIRLLFEHISVVGGTIPITLQWCRQLEGVERVKRLLEAKEICEEALQTKDVHFEFYEHGILRKSDGEYNKMSIKRHLVRIARRLILTGEATSKIVAEGREVCRELCDIAARSSKWNIADICLISCAKFYSAVGDHEEAIECYNDVFKSMKRDDQNQGKWAWAVTSFAEAVFDAGNDEQKARAVKLCSETLRDCGDLTNDVTGRLSAVLDKLKNPA